MSACACQGRCPCHLPRSERDRLIVAAYERGDVTERELAARYGLCRPRISQIVTALTGRDHRRLVSRPAPAGAAGREEG